MEPRHDGPWEHRSAPLGREQEELLVRYGLPGQHLSELAIGLDAFEALMMQRDLSMVKRIDARAERKAFYRHRFQDDPTALVAWRFARSPRTPAKKVKAEGVLPALPPGSGSADPLP